MDDRRTDKREYVKPQIVAQKDIEAITGICQSSGQNTGQDKMTADPNTSVCLNPMTWAVARPGSTVAELTVAERLG